MRPAATVTTRLSLDGSAGPIEVVVEEPSVPAEPEIPGGATFAVLCHPHPLFGGTMDNKVVTTLARSLHECGVPTLRFNFRGVGASAGVHDEGRGETDDAGLVAAWGAARWPGRRLILGGFSFGSYVACRLSQRLETSRLLLIAPPVGRFDFPPAAQLRAPSLVLQGEADEIVAFEEVQGWALAGGAAMRLVTLPGVGHFFHGHLQQLRDGIITAIRSG